MKKLGKGIEFMIKKWPPHPDSNQDQSLRKAPFYPVKLWGERLVFYQNKTS